MAAPRILIADDQPDVLEALRLLLKPEGFQTEQANSPSAALDMIETRDFDGAIIDLNYARDLPVVTLLSDGRVLATGGPLSTATARAVGEVLGQGLDCLPAEAVR